MFDREPPDTGTVCGDVLAVFGRATKRMQEIVDTLFLPLVRVQD